jgi:hypothetical protein
MIRVVVFSLSAFVTSADSSSYFAASQKILTLFVCNQNLKNRTIPFISLHLHTLH